MTRSFRVKGKEIRRQRLIYSMLGKGDPPFKNVDALPAIREVLHMPLIWQCHAVNCLEIVKILRQLEYNARRRIVAAGHVPETAFELLFLWQDLVTVFGA